MNEDELTFTIDELDTAVQDEISSTMSDPKYKDKQGGVLVFTMMALGVCSAVRRRLIEAKKGEEE